jgi:hypothetical protein
MTKVVGHGPLLKARDENPWRHPGFAAGRSAPGDPFERRIRIGGGQGGGLRAASRSWLADNSVAFSGATLIL